MKPNACQPRLATLLCVLFTSCLLAQTAPNWHALVPGKDYQPGRIALNFKPGYHLFNDHEILDPELAQVCASAGDYQIRIMFPNHEPRPGDRVDLSGWIELRFDPAVYLPALIDRFSQNDKIRCAEPRLIYYTAGNPVTPPAFVPDDPMVGQQWNLNQIQAFEGWELEQGDTSVLIGMVDTGADYLHPDLATQIALNYADPINGADDDGNGFVDDYFGWDFGNSDNDPLELPGPAFHGTGTAGIAAAATDNGVGVAAPGFHSRVVIAKTHDDNVQDLSIINPEEAIVYLADRGCQVINNSWGGPAYSELGNAAVQYAILNKDAMVLACAHNQGLNVTYYPAGYAGVVSVAGTVQGDLKYDISNYGSSIDVAAPTQILSPYPGGTYGNFAGTSASCPMAAGVAALIRAHFPQFNALQASEQLRMTCDNIDALNPDFAELLGRGRINMFRALSETGMPSVRAGQISFADYNDNIFEAGDTIRLSGVFTNYLSEATNLTVTASAPGGSVTFLNDVLNIGVLGTLDTFDNQQNPFVFIINSGVPADEPIQIRLALSADNYSDFQRFEGPVLNITYRNLEINHLKTTVTARGRLGYNKDGNSQGIGVQYESFGQLVYFPIGLMMGNASFKVSDGAWTGGLNFDDDFKIMEKVTEVPGSLADEMLTCAFNDSLSGTQVMGLSVRQNVYAWSASPDDRYFIAEYRIANNSALQYSNFYVGLHYETDVLNYAHNKATQDSALRMGYVWDTDQDVHTGIRLLSPTPFRTFAYDWGDLSSGVNFNNGFSTSEKYFCLKGNHPDAGLSTTEGSDVGLVVSSGPFAFQSGDTLVVAFAVVAGNSLADLTAGAVAAGIQYNGITSALNESFRSAEVQLLLFPNPVTDALHVEIAGRPDAEQACIEVFDLTGKQCAAPVQAISEQHFSVTTSGLPRGAYFLKYTGRQCSAMQIFVKN